MAYFQDEKEVYQYLGGVFQLCFKDAALAEEFGRVGITIRLNYTEPESSIWVNFGTGQVDFGTSTMPVDAEMSMTADTGHKFWLGKLNATTAMAKGQMRAKGPVPKILKLLPIAKKVFPLYRQLLEDAGRADLVAAA
ncbi:MAG: SCP2 sterol-binding domain-containing protein [Actinomycetota bacterium]